MSGHMGRRIRGLRKAQRWSQEELAQKVGLSRQQVYRIEAGETGTKLSTLEKLARAFGVPVSVFLEPVDVKVPAPKKETLLIVEAKPTDHTEPRSDEDPEVAAIMDKLHDYLSPADRVRVRAVITDWVAEKKGQRRD